METAYRKVGRKYVPVGIYELPPLENGAWLVLVNGSATSVIKIVDKVNLSVLAAEKQLVNKLVEVAGRKKDPDIWWGHMDKQKPKRLTPKQVAANKDFCEAFRVSSTWINGDSLYSSVEKVVKQAIKELS